MSNSADRNRELFEQFKALHARSQSEEGTGDPGLDMLLRTTEPSFAALIQDLAIPHWFDEQVVASVAEADSPAGDTGLFDEILSLSFIRSHRRGYSFHDVARGNLRRYLARRDPEHFRRMSRRYADVITQREFRDGDEELIWELTYMALATDEASGLDSLDSLVKAARRDRRFTVFKTLLDMAAEQSMMISSKGNTRIEYYRGLLAFDLRRWEEAEKRFGSLNLDELQNSFAGYAQLYRGMSLEVKGQPNEAARVYQDCLKELRDSDEHHDLMARLYERQAQAYLSLGDLKTAESYAKKSVAANEKSGDPFGMALNFETLGRIYQSFRDITSAQRAFETSIEMLDKAGREFTKAQIFTDMAMLFSSFARQEDAIRYYQKALEVKVEAGDNYGLAFIYSNLGNVYLQSNATEDALRHFRSSLKIFKQFKDRLNSAKVLRCIALTHERRQEPESAIEQMQQAAETLPEKSRWRSAYQKELRRLQKVLRRSQRSTLRKIMKVLGIIGLVVLCLSLLFLAVYLIGQT